MLSHKTTKLEKEEFPLTMSRASEVFKLNGFMSERLNSARLKKFVLVS